MEGSHTAAMQQAMPSEPGAFWLKVAHGSRPALQLGRVKVRSPPSSRCLPDAVAGRERQEPLRVPKENARLPELASHTLPNPVFWEAGPKQTSS